jgi:competence protein ComEA
MQWYFSRTEQVVVVLLVVGVLGALGAMAYLQLRPPPHPPTRRQVTIERAPPTPVAPPAAPAPPPPLVIHVTGAVRRPGVYTVPARCRVYQALARAGGVRRTANPEALNLAAPLEDGMRLFVPTKAEWARATANRHLPPLASTRIYDPIPVDLPTIARRESGVFPTSPSAPVAAPTLVPLNTATAEELMTLPGVGPATAQRILAYREAHRAFGDVSELLNVPGIGAKTLEKLAPHLTM